MSLEERLRSGLGLAAILSAVWIIAAALRPTATYHLAPILIAGAVPVAAGGTGLTRSTIVRATLAGAGVAMVAALTLAALDLLRGPTLLPYGGALAEAATFAVLGSASGLVAVVALSHFAD